MPDPSLLQRLKERKLVQWAVAYLAGAFVVFQLLDALEGPLGLSTNIQRAILAVVAVGFFITLILAWYHGEMGRQRVSGAELLMIALLLVIAGTGISLLRGGEEAAEPTQTAAPAFQEDDEPSIAVLPCANMSPNPADGYLAAGLHDEILLKLQKISSLTSLGRTSVLQYADNPPAPNVIASALGVRFIGECSVRKEGDRIRLIFQLLDGSTGVQLQAEVFDRDLTVADILDIQSDIAQEVARAVGAEITPDEEVRLAAVPTSNWEAFDRYIRGNVLFSQRTLEANIRAVEQYQLALEADSLFAAAYARIAMCLAQKVDYSWFTEGETEDALLAEGLEKAEIAIRLAPESGDAWVAKGYVLEYLRPYDVTERLSAFQQAASLDPRNLEAHNRLAWAFFETGQDSAAMAEGQKALEIDPRFHIAPYLFGEIAYANGDLERAEAMYDSALAMAPYYRSGYELRGLTRARRGNIAGAQADAEAVERLGNWNRAEALLALLDALEGREAEARARLRESGQPGVNWVRVLAVLGEEDQALDYLEAARVWPTDLRDSFLDPLRDHPRFQALLERYRGEG